jgi:hypothetical protein
VTRLNRLLERCGFHLPFLHDWLAERDDLRRRARTLASEVDARRAENQALASRLAETEALFMPPGHFYSPIPSLRDLQASRGTIFENTREIPGVDLNEGGQLALLDRFRPWYGDQPFTAERIPGRRYYFENPNYSYADAMVLYFMMRHLRPARIIEVGSGHSSCAMLDVDELLFSRSIDFTFIEPFPERLLLDVITKTDRSRLQIYDRNVQDVDLAVYEKLQRGDILFIDSSHVCKTGSDVNHLLFKVLPVLQPGVNIHIHDIFHSFEYPVDWVFEGRAWNEAYLLRAFLSHNAAFKIQFFTSYLMHCFHNRFAAEFPLMLKCPGGGLWLVKT